MYLFMGKWRTALIIPTLNAGSIFRLWLQAFEAQSLKPGRLLLIDSSSTDETTALARESNFDVHIISMKDFNHGGTRQLAVELNPDMDIIIFLTQDAILAHPLALENLLACFNDPKVCAVYGRQLPRKDANPIEAHARLFNYPPVRQVKTMADAQRFGIKTAFISNSFAAYRRTALMSVGGFPSNTILCEDTFVAAKMLLAGWKIAYCAEAQVYHSHNYGYIDEFKRYFDLGVFHSREPWIRQSFGQAEGEGKRYVLSELKLLWNENPVLIPSAFLRTILKFGGYKLGFAERFLPSWLKRHMSMHPRYWITA